MQKCVRCCISNLYKSKLVKQGLTRNDLITRFSCQRWAMQHGVAPVQLAIGAATNQRQHDWATWEEWAIATAIHIRTTERSSRKTEGHMLRTPLSLCLQWDARRWNKLNTLGQRPVCQLLTWWISPNEMIHSLKQCKI